MSSYQSKYTGKQVEDVLDNAILKKEQILTDNEKQLVKKNLGITEPDLSDYATKKDVEDAVSSIPTPDVSGQIEEHNNDELAHPYIQNELAKVNNSIPTSVSQLDNDSNFVTEDTVSKLIKTEFEKLPEQDVSGQISAALTDYVKKVEGKGLSTNDFTNELKQTLEDISNYDLAEIEEEVDKLETTLNTLVSGDASQAIESFNEIIAFLENVSDTESLSGIIAGINTRVAEVEAKIPTKVSELENDKNYLTEHQSLSHLATKNELNTKQDKIEDLDAIREGASRTIPTKTSELTNDSGFLTEHQNISHLATKDELKSKQDVISDLSNIREGAAKGATALQSIPEEYVTESELDKKGYLTKHQDITHLATKTEVGEGFNVLEAIVNTKAGAFYVENETGLFVIFKDEASKSAYLTSGDEIGVLGKFALGGANTETVYMMTVNVANENYNFTTSSEKMEITAGFTSQVKYTEEEGYKEFKEAAIFSVSVIKSGAESVVVSSGNVVKQGETFTFDVKPYVGNGNNTVVITAEGLVSASKGVVAVGVSVTSMSLSPFNFKWSMPFVQGSEYKLGGLKILGTLDKKLHIKVTGEGYSKDYEVNIGTFEYADIAYTFDYLEHPNATGVYKVEMWLEAVESGLLSETLSYRIMCIASEDTSTAQLICINETASEVLNYSENKLFSYAVYNGGSSSATPTITIHKDSDIIATNTLDVATGVIHEYSYSFMLNIAESTAIIGVFASFGNEQAAIITLKNEASLAPVSGYSFYMDAATRSNGDDSKESFVNETTQEKVSVTWKDMAWVNGMDGWTTDDKGNKCLLIPAMSSAEVALTLMKNVSTVTIEMLYKVSNVSDFSEDIITILKDTTSSWIGMRIKPTNITLHSQSLFTDDLKQGYNTKDEEIVHLVVTIISNYSGIGNVAMIYVNGVKKCSFEWVKGDTFAHDGVLKLGSKTADLYLYKMRVYGFAFSWQQVMQNYVSSIFDLEYKAKFKRKEDSVLNDANELDYDKVYGVYNTFVVELPKGTQIPNRKNNPSNNVIEGTNLYINIVQDKSCTIQGDWLNIPLEGQGTTAMSYYRWNLRSKTSSAYDKFRITAKKNVASSMHSHKMGATRLYNDLNQAIIGVNEANGRVAVYQYPVYGFQKIENEDKPGTYYYQFIGLYTIGPDKGDKSTFGYDNQDYENTLIHMEGTDHSPRGVGMEYPWEQMVVGLNEKGDAFLGAADENDGMAEGAWEIGACGDKKSVSEMKAYLDIEFAPAYKLDYECTPMIVGLPSGITIESVNSNVKDFRSQTADNGFAYADCLIYIEGEYDIYYFNINSQTYVKDGRKVYKDLETYGFSTSELESKSSVLDKTKYIRQYRMTRYRAEVGNYWLLDDSIFHACFLDLIGATDNEKKNSYPYKFGTLASGSRWRWRQDDLDTIFDVNNQGSADKKYSIMNTDKNGEGMVFKGNTSYHWRCIREYYRDEYKAMMKTIMNKMVELCPPAYGNSQIQKLVGCIRKYFWDYAQEYFTSGAYNIDAKWTYEDTWAIYQSDKSVNAVHPLQQSLGSHYEAEVAWITLRMLFLASMNEFGAFADYVDSSEGQVSFRQGGDFSFSLTPAIDMNPAVIQGKNSKKMYAGKRVMAGESVTITMPTDTSSDTMVYIQGADWLSDIGDFSKVQIGSSDKKFSVSSKRVQKIKVGDETASEVTTNIDKLDIGYCPSVTEVDARNVNALSDNVDLSKCPRLRKAYFGGTSVTAIVLPDGAKIQEYDLPSSLIRLSLRKLPLLTTDGLTYDTLDSLSYLWVEDNKNIEGYELLKTALDGGSPLNNIRVIGFDRTGDATDITFLMTLANGNYHGIDAEGNNDDSGYPIIEGKLHIVGSASGKDRDFLFEKFPALVLTADKFVNFIEFDDKEVLSVLLANGVGADGGITEEQAAAVTSIGTWFTGNTSIESFDEFEKFTGVTELDFRAFYRSSIKYITFPSSLVKIISGSQQWEAAFKNCTSLKKVNGTEQLKYIGDYSFSGTINLEAFDAVNLETIGGDSFSGSGFKGTVNFPKLKTFGSNAFSKSGVTGIESLGQIKNFGTGDGTQNWGGYGAFYQCTNLGTAKLPESLEVINGFAFAGCTSLFIDSFSFPYLKELRNNAFYNCTSLAIEDLSLPNLETLGQNAFYGVKIKKISNLGKITSLPTANNSTQNFGDKSVLEEVVLPDAITSVLDNSFHGYKNLIKCNIPSSVTTIGSSAFRDCNNLYYENLVLNNVTSIAGYAFDGVLIDKIVLPNIQTFSSINYRGAFPNRTIPMTIDIGENCTDLNSFLFSYSPKVGITMICRAGTPPNMSNPFHASSAYFEVIYIPDASVTAYREASGWSAYADRIYPMSVFMNREGQQ